MIGWTTNEASNSQVEYGLTASYGSSTTINASMVVSHSQALSGLTASTLYHYRVKSRDAAGNLATSTDFTFTTSTAPDVTAPVISGVNSSGISQSTAVIGWTTNEASNSQVEYGLTASYGSSTTINASMVVSHSQALSGLTASTLYHYRVKSRDAAGNLATSTDFTFTTSTAPDVTAPVISGVNSSGISQSTAVIGWTTNEASDSQVEYGLTASYGSSTTINASMVVSHSQALSGLAASTLYHYRVKSRDAAGNLATSTDFTFTTSSDDSKAPPVISGIIAAGITSSGATIFWTTDKLSDSQIDYGTRVPYANSTAVNAALVAVHTQTLSGLASSTLYHYRVRSRDADGNVTVSADNVFTTLAGPDTTAPTITMVSTSGVTASSATVTWRTSESADSLIQYGPTASYGNSTPLDSTMVTSHSLSLSGLAPNTQYHYRVRSGDAAGNVALSGDFVLTTLTASDTAPPVISSVVSSGIAQSSAFIIWSSDEASDSQVEYGSTTAYGTSTALNPALVTSHTQQLTNLTANTLYHYRVKSRDAFGNLAVSPDFVFTTLSAPGTSSLVISGIIAVGIKGDGATIFWSTNELSDSQVEYGTIITYGQATPVAATMVTVHTQSLSGLTPSTIYHYRVKSRNAEGTLVVSEDNVFTTTAALNEQPPAIASVYVMEITKYTATIGWTTNAASDSQIEYGLTTGYGASTPRNPSQVTAHVQTISGLAPGTQYHYRVKSATGGSLSVTSTDFTFSTADSSTQQVSLYFPRPVSSDANKAPLAADAFLGFAIANLDGVTATLKITAFDTNGTATAGPNLTNPVQLELNPGEQIPIIDQQIFGEGLAGQNSVGWIAVESNVNNIFGFFMLFDSRLSVLDGAASAAAPLTSFVLPEIEDRGFTKVHVINPAQNDATIVFDLMTADGYIRNSETVRVYANGAALLDLYSDLFAQETRQGSDYIRATSDMGVIPSQLLGRTSQYIEALNGQDATVDSASLYSPQYAFGGGWRTALSIVNLDPTPGQVSFRFFSNDGVQTGITRTLPIKENGKIYLDDPTFFQPYLPAPDALNQGYVEITTSGIRLTGSVVFSDAGRETFSSALPLTASLEQSVVFSHLVSNEAYYTGISVLNPNPSPAFVTIDVYDETGILQGTISQSVLAKHRLSGLLTEFFPSLIGQSRNSGYIRVRADKGISAFALFGTQNLSALSAIPPQVVR